MLKVVNFLNLKTVILILLSYCSMFSFATVFRDSDHNSVNAKALCHNPAPYICNENLNPNILDDKRSENQFKRIVENAKKDPKLLNFIKQKSGSAKVECLELEDSDDYMDCVKLRYKIMEEQFFTKKRKQIALGLFQKAKLSLLTVIEKKYLSLQAIGMKTSKKTLLQMKKEIEEATLYFGSPNHQDISYNASARNRGHDSDEILYQILGPYAETTNTVFLEGVILNAEYNPEALYRTFLHEISHFIDPSEKFREDENYSNNPFQRELQCLKRKDSSFAQAGDATCFEKIGNKYKSKNSVFSEEAKLTAKLNRENPDVGWSSPNFPPNEEVCQSGQLGEAFSDWLATEGYLINNPLSNIQAMDGISESNGVRTINLQERFRLFPDLLESVAGFCSQYHLETEISWSREKQKGIHPRSTDRLNAIMLAHPKVKQALGCSPSEMDNLQSLDGEQLEQGSVYCGKQLYGKPNIK